jgi:hypothetical protein
MYWGRGFQCCKQHRELKRTWMIAWGPTREKWSDRQQMNNHTSALQYRQQLLIPYSTTACGTVANREMDVKEKLHHIITHKAKNKPGLR